MPRLLLAVDPLGERFLKVGEPLFQDIVSGVRPVRRYDGSVRVQDQSGSTMAVWRFARAVPTKLVGPTLNAKTGDIAIEELHLAHEGLHLEGTT